MVVILEQLCWCKPMCVIAILANIGPLGYFLSQWLITIKDFWLLKATLDPLPCTLAQCMRMLIQPMLPVNHVPYIMRSTASS